jgi:hypothetical protein
MAYVLILRLSPKIRFVRQKIVESRSNRLDRGNSRAIWIGMRYELIRRLIFKFSPDRRESRFR